MTKQQAAIAGRTLTRLLRGEGWVIGIHENLGWHMRASKQLPGGYWLSVTGEYLTGMAPYGCLFGDGEGVGLAAWSPGHYRSEDPNKAVERAVKAAKDYLKPKVTAVAEAEAFLRDSKKQ